MTVVFGIWLVKNVYNEIAQREKIEMLASNLEKANSRLQDLDKQKSEFVSFATHQLRAPLTAMKGYASLLIDGDMGKLPAEAKLGVGRIYESSSTLANIVDDYLNISRIELGTMKYTFETISLKDMVENVIAELKPNIEKSKLAFTFRAEDDKAGYSIRADKDKLKQVIANLIDNSVKYTPSGSVKVTLSRDVAGRKIVFKLQDTGIGIDPQVLPLLFQKFTRANNANKVNIKGTGLGLFVAKEIVAAHKGTIRVESPGEGRGSTFIVELEPAA
ncbi:MAG: HAMP domain-containing sensor histidine kinase [Candidatus Paceibacterota bacterium]